MEVPTIYKAYVYQGLISGDIPRNYGLKYGTLTYLHLLDPF